MAVPRELLTLTALPASRYAAVREYIEVALRGYDDVYAVDIHTLFAQFGVLQEKLKAIPDTEDLVWMVKGIVDGMRSFAHAGSRRSVVSSRAAKYLQCVLLSVEADEEWLASQ